MKGLVAVRWGVRIALLLFVAGSIGYLYAKEYGWGGFGESPAAVPAPATMAKAETVPIEPHRVVAYYFHGDYRCAACMKIEEYSRAAIEKGFPADIKDGLLSFEAVNVEEPQNRHFIRDYDLVSKTVVLSLKDGDKEVRFKNLDRVWRLLGSREQFIAYVQDETRGFLGEVRR